MIGIFLIIHWRELIKMLLEGMFKKISAYQNG